MTIDEDIARLPWLCRNAIISMASGHYLNAEELVTTSGGTIKEAPSRKCCLTVFNSNERQTLETSMLM